MAVFVWIFSMSYTAHAAVESNKWYSFGLYLFFNFLVVFFLLLVCSIILK